jgi:hypothetical protein
VWKTSTVYAPAITHTIYASCSKFHLHPVFIPG